MRLNHIDLPVPDVIEARDFFVRYLGFTHQRTLGDGGLSILRGEDGMTLIFSRLQRSGSQTWPEPFHIGFHLPQEADVTALHQRVTTEAGLDTAEPRIERGAFSFYFTAPGGILVEVAQRT
jgi:catechol 2,3-dioxygenase-like lactoylglutathione lyase family enzyme